MSDTPTLPRRTQPPTGKFKTLPKKKSLNTNKMNLYQFGSTALNANLSKSDERVHKELVNEVEKLHKA